ncbi:MAG: glucose-6-phosphate dehydrogenase, partial [Actinomycetota bacterium]
MIEKPFGRDRESSDELVREMGKVFREAQTFRIDHYLGKEVIQNLMVLRFANRVFEPVWNREYIDSVQISWKEDLSVEGRGGYFDHYGIVRDVMQNHLLQILALVAMEPATRLDAGHICNEKIRVLRCIAPLALA